MFINTQSWPWKLGERRKGQANVIMSAIMVQDCHHQAPGCLQDQLPTKKNKHFVVKMVTTCSTECQADSAGLSITATAKQIQFSYQLDGSHLCQNQNLQILEHHLAFHCCRCRPPRWKDLQQVKCTWAMDSTL